MTASLTFGLELEFLAVFKEGAFNKSLPNASPDDIEENVGTVHAIAQCFEDHGIKASKEQTYERWYIHEDAVRLSPNEVRELPRGYYQEAIEISSRKFNMIDDWQEEVQQVLSVLHLMRGQFNCQFVTNETTGLHVHIGDLTGHSLTTVKRMTQIATAHERNLDRIHNADRIVDIMAAPLMDMDNDYPRPLFAGLSFFNASAEDSHNMHSILDVMESIESKTCIAELGYLFRVRYQGRVLDGHACTLNLDNLYSDPNVSRHAGSRTGTMEFRQHGGDLDCTEIILYISFLANLTEFCATATDAKIIALAAQGVNINYDLKTLLSDLHCDADLIHHFCNRKPRYFVTATDPFLQPLVDINDRESAVRRSVAAIEAAIARKIETKVYGTVFEAGFTGEIPLRESDYDWMLSCAEKEISATGQHPLADLKSQARQETFRKVANMYLGLDKSGSPNQPIVQDQLLDWMVKYGEPQGEIEAETVGDEDELENEEGIGSDVETDDNES